MHATGRDRKQRSWVGSCQSNFREETPSLGRTSAAVAGPGGVALALQDFFKQPAGGPGRYGPHAG